MGCTSEDTSELEILWYGKQAAAIVIHDHPDEVYVSLSKDPSGIHILGKVEKKEGEVHFQPLISLTYNQTYYVFDTDGIIGSVFVSVPDGISPPELTAVYPTSDTLPQNLLKIYLLFSKPISEGSDKAIDKIQIMFGGSALPVPFLDLKPELWNYDRTMLTLWLDPGRIKTGLIPNLKMGLPLEIGMHTLVVSDQWRDLYGLSLLDGFEKVFTTDSIDSNKPNTLNWNLELPTIGSREPLVIHFDEPLDYATAMEGIEVTSHNEILAGVFILSDHEQRGIFRPDEIWDSTSYRIKIKAGIEDLSGNNLNRLFEEIITVDAGSQDYFWIDFTPNIPDSTDI